MPGYTKTAPVYVIPSINKRSKRNEPTSAEDFHLLMVQVGPDRPQKDVPSSTAASISIRSERRTTNSVQRIQFKMVGLLGLNASVKARVISRQ